jgi:hypothetical protein
MPGLIVDYPWALTGLMRISTRRFIWRPTGVALVATGRLSP